MTLDGIILKGIFEHERLKPAIIRRSHGNVQNLAELKQVMNTEFKTRPIFFMSKKYSLCTEPLINFVLTSFHSLTWLLHQVCI